MTSRIKGTEDGVRSLLLTFLRSDGVQVKTQDLTPEPDPNESFI